MTTSPLDAVTALCDEALTGLVPGPGRDLVAAVRARLGRPLTVTVAGGVSSGKSTLVNALLGQRIAAVDAGECTRVVTTFCYGAHERAEVLRTDGRVDVVALERGGLPASLGVPLAEVASLTVHLSNENLRGLAVVDTPGLNTVTEANEAATAAFLGVDTASAAAVASARAVSSADALVFLMPYLRKADAEVLAGFRALYDGSGLSAVNAVAVLSKVDRLSPDGDPLAVAAPIAARVRADLAGLVCDVVPVVGLLAETARAGRFTEDDARAVAAVAAVADELDREDLLLSPQDFLTSDLVDLPDAARRRLLGLLDLHGLRVAVATHDAGGRGAGAIVRALAEHSGVDALRRVVLERFAARAGLLKAHAARCDLLRASYGRDDPDNRGALARLRAPLERIELDPAMHQLRVYEVMHAVGAGELRLPGELQGDLDALVGEGPVAGGGPQERRAAAVAGAARWARFGQDPRRSPLEARMARTVKQAYELLVAEADVAVAR